LTELLPQAACGSARELGAAGGVQAVVAAMLAHRASESVQWSGCLALARLTTTHKDNQDLGEAAGAVQAVADAMLAHGPSERVQRWVRSHVAITPPTAVGFCEPEIHRVDPESGSTLRIL
jgi:hypothetical protein